MPGKAKKPTNQSITTITAIVNNVFIPNSLALHKILGRVKHEWLGANTYIHAV
jgi:hypothetical protein